jgi:hypothetical protein
MSAVPAVTAQDLELEHAELLPARETLWAMGSSHPAGDGDGNTEQAGLINVAAGNGDLDGGGGDGNTEQAGLIDVAAGNGDLDGSGGGA